MVRYIVMVLLVVGSAMVRAGEAGVESAKHKNARMEWWREARFGMFIHWGLYAIPAQGEWVMYAKKIPVAAYATNAPVFNPVKFDAKQVVATAKSAGMKYLVVTAKHHEGFAMFATKASDYNIMDATPFKRDVIRELSEACRKAGLKFGVYYSIGLDWHHPGGGNFGQPKWDPAQKGDPEAYMNKVAIPQVRELLNHYRLDLVWWDGGTPDVWDSTLHAHTAKLYEEFKPFPKLIVNNRLYDNYRAKQLDPEYWKPVADPVERFARGDYATPECHIPDTVARGIDWETCETMNRSWGYSQEDNQWKSAETLVRNLCDIASKGGNYLLNVGPTSEGLIPQPSLERLAAVGEWMKVNGEAIYGTSGGPFKSLPWGRCTMKVSGSKTLLYLHVFNWPADGVLVVPGLSNTVKSARLLADGKRLEFATTAKGLEIKLPPTAPDKISSTVVLKIKGSPELRAQGKKSGARSQASE